jgi:hypothetical protein
MKVTTKFANPQFTLSGVVAINQGGTNHQTKMLEAELMPPWLSI